MTELKNDLVLAINDPSVLLYSDEFIVIIADIYPKSKYHFLVMPKENIRDIRCLKPYHVPKLIYMEHKGLEFVMQATGLSAKNIQVGYHAYPSMNRLHLHILSKDFNSTYLKESYQWNSFHTEFFIPTYKAISNLQKYGIVKVPPNKKCLQQKLYCHKCEFYSSNSIESMKLHLSSFHSGAQRVF